jgi:hypothetical protein
VLTISGRTIKADALAPGSTACGEAAARMDALLAKVPAEAVAEAQAARAARIAK